MRLIDSCITQLKAQGPSRTCNEIQEEDAGGAYESQRVTWSCGVQQYDEFGNYIGGEEGSDEEEDDDDELEQAYAGGAPTGGAPAPDLCLSFMGSAM